MMPEWTWMTPFLADLHLVACAGALALYATWTAVAQGGIVRLARLSLMVAFLTSIAGFALSASGAGGPPTPIDLFAFALIAGFIGLEFLFHLSILGAGVAGLATLIAAADHVGLFTPGAGAALLPALASYWGIWRDGIATVGAASLVLCMGACMALGARPDRRSRVVQPSDLRDAAGMLARVSLFASWLALPAAGLALWHTPQPDFRMWLHAGALAVIALQAPAWLVLAESRTVSARRTASLVMVGGLGLAAFFLGDSALAHLTLAAPGP